MDTPSSLPKDGLFDKFLVGRLEDPADHRIDLHGGAKKRFRDFDPDGVMLVPPSLDERLPEGHLTRFLAELVEHELVFGALLRLLPEGEGPATLRSAADAADPAVRKLHRVQSSHEIERAYTDAVSFCWLPAQQAPDSRSIARFSRTPSGGLRQRVPPSHGTLPGHRDREGDLGRD